jgi:hypothetical protein
MNPTVTSRPPVRWLFGLSATTLALLAACGSGSNGGGALVVSGTIFGYDPHTGSFDATGQQGEAPLMPMNMCVVFDFSAPLKASSATSQSIVVQELDTSVTPPAPGPLAAVEYQVSGSRLTLCPLVSFTDTTAIFGWGDASDPNPKTYQILFQVPPSTDTLVSTGGNSLAVKDRGPYLFRTTSQIFDQNSGAPTPTMRLLNPNTGNAIATTNVPTSPVPLVEITFDEPVIPASVVDPGGTGTSTSLHVELDSDGNVATTGDRFTIPGIFELTETSTDATVLFTSNLTQLPTDPTTGCTYVVTVVGTVADLSGNTKVSETGNPAFKSEFPFTTATGPSTISLPPLTEPFDVQTNNDLTVTSAKWGTSIAGFLTPGIGGGTGIDGAFDPLNPAFQASPPSGITVTVGSKLVLLNTDSLLNPGNQRVYEFTSMSVPAGWTARASGPFPLLLQVSGSVTISGILSVAGNAGAILTGTPIVGGAGGAARAGGSAGGAGGGIADVVGLSTLFPNQGIGGKPTNAQYAFDPSGATNQGISGRSTALDTTLFTLTDANYATQLFALSTTDLWVQANVGADDYRFERTHPAFKVESITNLGLITVVSDPASPDYRGELSQETDNPWIENDGSGGLRAPLLAERFDSYVIGSLVGKRGLELFDLDLDGGVDDALAMGQSGRGSDPQAVAQSFLTLARSGGGGGGGGITAGADGADDPTVANGAGSFGGTGGSGAAGGTAFLTAILSLKNDADTLTVTTNVFDDGLGAPDPSWVGHLVNPNIAQGNAFVIATVDAVNRVTIAPITTFTGATIDLNTTTMPPGSTVRLLPPYNAGGFGGGGAGIHCAGSSKTAFNHAGHPGLGDTRNQNGAATTVDFYDDDGGIAPPNQVQDGLEDGSEPIFALPRWVMGGGGGSGGGSLQLFVAGNVDVSGTGQVLADGGEGGRSDVAGTTASSGGGGGAGGAIRVGAGGTLAVALGGRISATGGRAGAIGFGIEGGAGGDGRIRLENALGNLSPQNFLNVGTPTIAAEHLGRFPGGGDSVAQSLFLASGALDPAYQKVVVHYSVKEDGVTIAATYAVNPDGSIDTALSNPDAAPFDLLLAAASADPATGLVDLNTATTLSDPTTTPVSGYAGMPYVRFKFVLSDPSSLIIIGGSTYTDVRIDSIEINVDSIKP